MKTKNMVLTALFAALTIVFAQLIFPLPFTPVPLSLSLLPVFLAGAVLPKKHAAYSQLVYLLLGIAGLPVFAGFKGGAGVLFGPTGGFLLAYPIMAFLTAWILQLIPQKSFAFYFPPMLAALTACYFCGSLWYTFTGHVSWESALAATVAPFILFDCFKILICSAGAFAINNALKKSNLYVAS